VSPNFDDLDDPFPPTADDLMLSSVHTRAGRIRRQRRARIATAGGAAVLLAGIVGVITFGHGPAGRHVETATTVSTSTPTSSEIASTSAPSTTAARGHGGTGTAPTGTTAAPSDQILPGTNPPVPFSAMRVSLLIRPAHFRWADGATVTLEIRNTTARAFTFTPWATCRTEVSIKTFSGAVTGYPLATCLGLRGPVTLAPGEVVTVQKTLANFVPQLAGNALPPGVYVIDIGVFDTSLASQQLHSPPIAITVDAAGPTNGTSTTATATTNGSTSTTSGSGSGSTTSTVSTTASITAPTTGSSGQ